jgi:DNA-binding GntR family transcriptional regulator
MNISLLNPAPRRETLGANVLAQIKELLLTGQLMPGESLSLRSTAEALGVSVMPVREAVYQLVADQALEVAPNKSVRVPQLSAEQFAEITRIRLEIEGFAAEQAVANVSAELIQSLRALNDRLSDAMEQPGNKVDAVRLNKELHFSIYAAAQMPMLIKIIETMWLRIGPILNYDLRVGSERTFKKIAVKHHNDLITALQANDPAAARAALCGDIEGAFQSIYQKQFGQSAQQET